MKKILFTMMAALLLPGCSKEEESTQQTVLVNVSYAYADSPKLGKKIASPTLVLLYNYEEAANFDKGESVNTMANSQKIVLPNGSSPTPKYTSDSFSGINTIKNVENGKYMAIVFFKPDGFSWPMFYYYGYKEIIVNSDTDMKLYDLVFNWGNEYNGHFISL